MKRDTVYYCMILHGTAAALRNVCGGCESELSAAAAAAAAAGARSAERKRK